MIGKTFHVPVSYSLHNMKAVVCSYKSIADGTRLAFKVEVPKDNEQHVTIEVWDKCLAWMREVEKEYEELRKIKTP